MDTLHLGFVLFLLFLKPWFDCVDTEVWKGSWYYTWPNFIPFYKSFSSAIVHTATFNYSKIKITLVYSKPYTQRPKERIFLSVYVVYTTIFDSFIIMKSTSCTLNNFSSEFAVFRDVDYKLSVNIYKFLLDKAFWEMTSLIPR